MKRAAEDPPEQPRLIQAHSGNEAHHQADEPGHP